MRTRSVDILGEAFDGRLLHTELQSTNDPDIALRMLEYGVAIRRKFGRFPIQLVLYVGLAPLRMPSRIEEAGVVFEFRIIDIRDIDSEQLLASDCLEDNILAVLARIGDARSTVRRVLERIAASEPAVREKALAELTILAGLRKLGSLIEREAQSMPILDDIEDHDLLGPRFRRKFAEGMHQGMNQGLQQGMQQGMQQGETRLLVLLIEKRFGPLDASIRQLIETMDTASADDVGMRLLDAKNLHDLLG